jgi:DNA-binding transcriptional regulator YdaS (Cro superfamily)
VWLEQRIYDRGIQKIDRAKLLRVSPSVITQWTTGETKPARRRVAALACAVGVSLYESNLGVEDIEPRGELDTETQAHKFQKAPVSYSGLYYCVGGDCGFVAGNVFEYLQVVTCFRDV